jgi:glycosyltransferase involved in cell wall biosynthesis
MSKRTRVAIITSGEPADKRHWSGILFAISTALLHDFDDVVVIGPYKPAKFSFLWRVANSLAHKVTRKFAACYYKFFNKVYHREEGFIYGELFAHYFEQELARNGPFDLVVVPSWHAAVSFLTVKSPIFIVSDATLQGLIGYYDSTADLSELSRREMTLMEKISFKRASHLIYSSQWAADSVINGYQIPSVKVSVIPFGANLTNEPRKEDVIRKDFKHKLLFLGVDWKRKGGAIAFQCLKALVDAGIEVQLTVCGCVPPAEYVHPNMTVIPFLDKNKPKDYEQVIELLHEADFLLLPTRADCTPIAFCEASAYGLPVITSDTGGIADIVENGRNGFRLPLAAGGAEYAQLLTTLYANKEAYIDLSASSRDKYEKELNWSAWSKKVKELFLAQEVA